MALPILRSGVFFVSYKSNYDLRILPVTYTNIPTSYILPKKKVTAPKTEYHEWLQSLAEEPDAVYDFKELRKELIEKGQITKKIRSTVASSAAIEEHLTEVEQKVVDDIRAKISAIDGQIRNINSSIRNTRGYAAKRALRNQIIDLKQQRKEVVKELRLAHKKLTEASTKANTIAVLMSASQPPAISDYSDDDEVDPEDDAEEVVLEDGDEVKVALKTNPIPEPEPEPVDTNDPRIIAQQTENVFAAMTSINWRDKDEAKMSSSTLGKVQARTWVQIFPRMKKMADELFFAIHEKTGALDDAPENQRYDFLFHVIAKGESMYYQSIADPEFCIYLLDNYQPLYTMIGAKYGIS